ncbi:MAG: 2-polyprenyl-3-methyl-5-hydroxy-6-metoxy-1,4-benzoquinol methylase [Bacteroidia bacterium]|jgi:2-polyprenyl-3-methyl-5-hydroxy-6-metoxy-1,4-benzoquinol methylase
MINRKTHWESIYEHKALEDVSWYQSTPEISLRYIHKCKLDKTAKIIDIGGGDGFLVDHLLDLGYSNVTVLDISEAAINRAKLRLGKRASQVTWIVSDITMFIPQTKYDLWHDRATMHFLINQFDIRQYLNTLNTKVHSGGFAILGTFSENGPLKCSGIPIKQYSGKQLVELIDRNYEKVDLEYLDHQTPFNTVQNFVFGRFHRR